MSKDCNCKTKKDIKKVIDTVDVINRNPNKGYVKKNIKLRQIIFLILKLITYSILTIMAVILIVPIIIFIIAKRKKGIVIKIPEKYTLRTKK